MCLKQNSEIGKAASFPLNPFLTNVQSGGVTCRGLGTVVLPMCRVRLNNKLKSLELHVDGVGIEWESSHHNPDYSIKLEMCIGCSFFVAASGHRCSLNTLITAWQNCSSLCRFSSAKHWFET